MVWQSGVNWLRTSWTWAGGLSGKWRSYREQLQGGSLTLAWRNANIWVHHSEIPLPPTGLWVPEASASSVGGGKRVATHLGSFRRHSPASRASPPTEGWRSIQSTPKSLGIRNFYTGKNSKAGSQSSAGKGSSLEFICLWKGFLGYLTRPLLPESLKERSWKRVIRTLFISYAPGKWIMVITFMFLVTSWPLKSLGANRRKGAFWHHYPSSTFKTPAGSTAKKINAHSW